MEKDGDAVVGTLCPHSKHPTNHDLSEVPWSNFQKNVLWASIFISSYFHFPSQRPFIAVFAKSNSY